MLKSPQTAVKAGKRGPLSRVTDSLGPGAQRLASSWHLQASVLRRTGNTWEHTVWLREGS